MRVQIETCGNTSETCGMCSGRAYKYILNAHSNHRVTCDNAICIAATLMFLYQEVNHETQRDR